MSDHEIDTIKELLQIFASCDEDERAIILSYAQKLIEHPDLSRPTS